ncbi:hypothetical protein KSP39_PZI007250 [Platanthera zijinensis]|uniref:Uncharacterized protein n=1 Tax=Platanthera zijinensis TaxID=2320716 RepID=A0AAP0G9Z7_9ASPA
MDKKMRLLLRAMPPITDEGSSIRTRKGRNMETSLPFGSENLWRKSGLKFPETARLYSQTEYAAPKIIPSAANVATKLFLWKSPTEIRNSPRKLLVPGELILAKVERRKW